jgi:ubiquitin-conjugating enzyme E2 variant
VSRTRRPDGDPFEVAPYSPREVRFHLVGAALNGLVWLAAIIWLIAGWSQSWWGGAPSPLWIALAVLAGIYLADLASGTLHWAFDTWFDPDITFVRRMVLQVREHHIHPSRIFLISFKQDAGTLSWIALILMIPVFAGSLLTAGGSGGAAASYALLTLVVFDPLLVFMLEFHKCGHRPCGPWWVKALQKARLVLPVRHHLDHHQGNHDFNYCIINGWADVTLGRLGYFRALERIIEGLTGARPQRDDHEWFRRYGREVHPRPGQEAGRDS